MGILILFCSNFIVKRSNAKKDYRLSEVGLGASYLGFRAWGLRFEGWRCGQGGPETKNATKVVFNETNRQFQPLVWNSKDIFDRLSQISGFRDVLGASHLDRLSQIL